VSVIIPLAFLQSYAPIFFNRQHFLYRVHSGANVTDFTGPQITFTWHCMGLELKGVDIFGKLVISCARSKPLVGLQMLKESEPVKPSKKCNI
jgi:hypothetical protein